MRATENILQAYYNRIRNIHQSSLVLSPESGRIAVALLLFLLLACLTFPCAADYGCKQIFRSVANNLSPQDQQTICSALELQKTPDGKLVLSETCEVFPDDFAVELKDINGDGVKEVFIIGGNTCTSGHAGSSIWLFIKQKQHAAYKKNLDFPAAAYKLLTKKTKGFPDIQIGGPGFCEGVWRWNGQSYSHHKNVSTAPGGCDHVR